MREARVPGCGPVEAQLSGLRVGVAWLDQADPLVRARVQEAAANFPSRRELALSVPDREEGGAAFRREVVESHAGLYPERAEDYGDDVPRSPQAASELTDSDGV